MDTTRRRRGAAGWRGVLDRFEASGLRAVAFCAREGISSKSLYRWRSVLAKTPDQPVVRKAVDLAHIVTDFVDLGTLGREAATPRRPRDLNTHRCVTSRMTSSRRCSGQLV